MPRVRGVVPMVMLAVAAAVAGCGGDGEPSATTPPTETVAPDPGREVVGTLVAAADEGDTKTMWELLSAGSQRRYGPTLEEFEEGLAPTLRESLAPFAGGELPVEVSENIGGGVGLVALSRGDDAWATALRREGPQWRVDLPGRLRISVSGPPPGSRGKFVNQIGIEVTGRAGAGTALLYLDGVTLDAEVYPGPTSATVFANFASGIEPGLHTAVAFATSGDEAAATAWTFRP